MVDENYSGQKILRRARFAGDVSAWRFRRGRFGVEVSACRFLHAGFGVEVSARSFRQRQMVFFGKKHIVLFGKHIVLIRNNALFFSENKTRYHLKTAKTKNKPKQN